MQVIILLCKYDLQSSITDPCIFFQKALPRLITSIWVDDGLHCSKIMASWSKWFNTLKESLGSLLFQLSIMLVYTFIEIDQQIPSKYTKLDTFCILLSEMVLSMLIKWDEDPIWRKCEVECNERKWWNWGRLHIPIGE